MPDITGRIMAVKLLPGNLDLGSLARSGKGGWRCWVLEVHVRFGCLWVCTPAVAPVHQRAGAALLEQLSLHCHVLAQLLLLAAQPELLLLDQGLQLDMLQGQCILFAATTKDP